jgi:hypothetical protein
MSDAYVSLCWQSVAITVALQNASCIKFNYVCWVGLQIDLRVLLLMNGQF